MLTRSFLPASKSKDLLAYTPMLHARLFAETPKFRHQHFQPLREPLSSPSTTNTTTETPFLDGNPAIDRPLFVQFCANDSDELLAAAKLVAPYCDAVDLNLGCPQGIARKGHYGAFLQEDQSLIYSLINKLHKELEVPVTAKIRILETKEQSLEYARMVVDAGASIVTIHGRTREMKGHKTGRADWGVLRYIRENLGREVVVVGNGNVLQRSDIDDFIAETGVDGVMSAEGNLYDPAIFADEPEIGAEGREFWRGKRGHGNGWRMDAVVRRYMDIIYTYVLEIPPPERKPLFLPSDPDPESEPEPELEERAEKNGKRTADAEDESEQQPAKKQKRDKKEKTSSPNLLAMQPHLFHLLRPLVAKHHNVRDALARARAGDIAAFENVLRLTEIAVEEGIKEYEATDGKSWDVEMEGDVRLKVSKDGGEVGGNEEESSIEAVKRCKRPWWVVQAYVRPLPVEALKKGSLTLSKKEKEKAKMEAEGKGKVGVEVVEGKGSGKGEEVEVPREGLVCG